MLVLEGCETWHGVRKTIQQALTKENLPYVLTMDVHSPRMKY